MAAADSNNTYVEHDPRLGVTYTWHNATVEHRQTTHRGTLVEMVRRPGWGVACYMDGVIQSCERDEAIYHRALVERVLAAEPRSVCIVGGGEGATAREVLADPFVGRCDMIEWDADVVSLFRDKYPKWPAGAFSDSRLSVECRDVFEACKEERSYDAVIVDLFEPEEMGGADSLSDRLEWIACILRLVGWARRSVAIYAGMVNGPEVRIIELALEAAGFKTVVSYKVYIPSFMGEAQFVYASRA